MFETEDNTLKAQGITIWDNSKRARILLNVFGILLCFTILTVFLSYLELKYLKDIQINGVNIDNQSKLESHYALQGFTGLAQLGLYITSVIVFLNWFRRAYGNLHRMGLTDLKQSESMAIWVWFIPIICFFRPVQIMSEIWSRTQDLLKKFSPSHIFKEGSFLIGLWWTLFIIGNFVGHFVMRTVFKDETIEQLVTAAQATMVADVLDIPEGLLVMAIVSQLTKMESKLAQEVKKAGGILIKK